MKSPGDYRFKKLDSEKQARRTKNKSKLCPICNTLKGWRSFQDAVFNDIEHQECNVCFAARGLQSESEWTNNATYLGFGLTINGVKAKPKFKSPKGKRR